MPVNTTPRGSSLLLTIDRPPVNALDLETIEALRTTFVSMAADPPAGGVVLTGAGERAFSAGVDTTAFAGYDAAHRRALVVAITDMTAALLSIACPVVAAVNGHALGGGFVLMLACDLRLAVQSQAARFGLTEAQAGVPFPAGPAEIIRSELPANLLRRWTLSSEVVGAAALAEHNVIDALHPIHALVEVALQRVAALAAQPAFATVKRQVRGPLAGRVAALAAQGDDPFLASFL
ncbi:MAG: enoyl-CoA hydratase/isomerase family protein [Rhodospirillales bacterium]|nr:enoyl-CoA hydratase/isomerase family protein [Rhodospirillales bacterium]